MEMDTDSRMELVSRGAQEIVTEGELRILLENKERPMAYVGYEPSGFVHIGWLIITKKIEELIEAGFEVTVLLADWHAFINDKFGGDMDKIQDCGHYFIDCYKAYGLGDAVDRGDLKFRWASDLADNAKYWEKVLRVSKSSSLSRIKRAMTIMGRKESDGDLDTSKFIYPAMQASDIFELQIDLAIGGMDQRHAHMLARDVADKMGFPKPTALHTPLLPSLSRTGRMEMVTGATGGTDHEKMADRIEEDLHHLIENGTLSPHTQAIITGLGEMDPEKRHKAIEVLLAGKRRVGGKGPIYSILQRGESEEALINNREHKEMDKQLNSARRELYNYLGITNEDDDLEMKMSKSDPDSGIYLQDREDDIRRKIKKGWCPEGVPDNPVMEICRLIIFPFKDTLTIKRPEKWGGDLQFRDYDELRSVYGKKELHPADLKKVVADELVDILDRFRVYFKENPDSLKKVKKYKSSIGR